MRKDLIFISIICLIFISFALPDLYSLGLSSYEAGLGHWGIYLLKGKNICYSSDVDIEFFGSKLPTNWRQPYYFALPSYLLIPFFLVFGINTIAFRLLPITLSVLTLPLLYYVFKQLFNRKVASITVFLLALSPVFIHYSRIGLCVLETPMNFFFISSIFFFMQYHHKKKNFYLYLASYLLGAGLSIKLSYASRLIGLLFILVAFFAKESLNYVKTKLKARQIVTAIIFFCFGAFLFIYYNIATKGETFKLTRYLYHGFVDPAGSQRNNLLFGRNLGDRINHLRDLTTEHIDQTSIFDNELYPPAYNTIRQAVFAFLIIAFISNLIFALLFKQGSRKVRLLFGIYLLYAVMFLTSCFSPGSLLTHHLALLYPFPQLVIALFIDYSSSAISLAGIKSAIKKLCIALVSISILLPLALFDIRTSITYHAILKKTGGRGWWSPVLYDIRDYIKERRLDGYPIICVAWLSDAIRFITEGEADFNFDFIWYPQRRQSLFDKLKTIFDKNPHIYFITGVYGGDRDIASIFKQDIASLNKTVTLEKIFYNKAGEPQYYLYRAE